MAVTLTEQPRRVRLTLDLDEHQAANMAEAIYEARWYVLNGSPGGWRSDSTELFDLERKLWAWVGRPCPDVVVMQP
jgi:hypothetical protein